MYRWHALSQQARKKVETKFNPAAAAKKHAEVYEKLSGC
jgi:hypothetical protein